MGNNGIATFGIDKSRLIFLLGQVQSVVMTHLELNGNQILSQTTYVVHVNGTIEIKLIEGRTHKIRLALPYILMINIGGILFPYPPDFNIITTASGTTELSYTIKEGSYYISYPV